MFKVMNKITGIVFNWHYTHGIGESSTGYLVGAKYKGKTPIEIIEHTAGGEGDKWFYDVKFDDGSVERIFNPNQVFFSSDVPSPNNS